MNLTVEYLANTFPHITWTIGIMFFLLAPVTIIGNGLVLASILRDPYKNIRTAPSSYIIFNLALADLLVGVLVEPISGICTIYAVVKKALLLSEEVTRMMAYGLLGVSLITLIVLSADRLIAVRSPLKYKTIVSKTKLKTANILMWICLAFYAIGGYMIKFRFKDFLFIEAVNLAILTIALSVLNFAVVRSLRICGRKLTRLMDSDRNAVMQTVFNREKAVARTTATVVIAFLVCLLPYGIISAVSYSFKKIHNMIIQEILTWMYYSSMILMFINSTINPFLYAWRLPKYRKSYRYIFFQIITKMTFSQSVLSPREECNKCEDRQRHRNVPHQLRRSSLTTSRSVCISVLDYTIKEHIYKPTENTKL